MLHQAASGTHSSTIASRGCWGAPRRRKQIKGLRLQALISGICLRVQIERDELVGVIYTPGVNLSLAPDGDSVKPRLFTAWMRRRQRLGFIQITNASILTLIFLFPPIFPDAAPGYDHSVICVVSIVAKS